MADVEAAPPLEDIVKSSKDNEFFTALEKYVKYDIPIFIRKILTFNGYNTAIALSTFDDDSVLEMEEFMRKDFISDMLGVGEKIEDYLGKFVKCQANFIVFGGHKRLIKKIVKACQRFYDGEPIQKELSNEASGNGRSNNENKKNTLIRELRRLLFNWIAQQNALVEIPEEELNLKIREDTYRENNDGSVSLDLSCPFPSCNKGFTLTWKSYKTYYKPRRGSENLKQTTKPTWHLAFIQKHISDSHKIIESNDNNDNLNSLNNGRSPSDTQPIERSDDSNSLNNGRSSTETQRIEPSDDSNLHNNGRLSTETQRIEPSDDSNLLNNGRLSTETSPIGIIEESILSIETGRELIPSGGITYTSKNAPRSITRPNLSMETERELLPTGRITRKNDPCSTTRPKRSKKPSEFHVPKKRLRKAAKM